MPNRPYFFVFALPVSILAGLGYANGIWSLNGILTPPKHVNSVDWTRK